MFGSNFEANFGLTGFPFQGVDPQGGLFGPNTPIGGGQVGSDPLGRQSGLKDQALPLPSGGAPAPVASQQAVQGPGQVPLPGSSVTPPGLPQASGNPAAALAPSPLAAGIGSEFSKGNSPYG